MGVRNEALAALHTAAGATQSAVVTACNPFSQRLPDDVNVGRQAMLAAWLRDSGLALIEGAGEAPDGSWPREPSYLVLGVSREAAREIGLRFEQNAVIWSGERAVPELLLLR